jgi:hypothetical protein
MSSKYRYEIIMYWSEEDQAFIAEVPELPGCARRWRFLSRNPGQCGTGY